MTLEFQKNKKTKKIFFLIFGIFFIVFLFTSDGHRYTIDEFQAEQMAFRMVTLEPESAYVEGESKMFFNTPIMNPKKVGPVCSNGITCYPASILHSITEVPFIAFNHYFHIITTDTLVFTIDDFLMPHYIFWRNSENVDLVFMELFYSPFFSAFSAAVFFLICLEHKFSRNNSIILAFLLAFSTMIWAYSNTSLNVVPASSFLLLGYLFYKKFQRLNHYKLLIFSSAFLGLAFLIRVDIILFIIPLWVLLLISVLQRNTKMYSLIFYSIPILISYFIYRVMNSLRYQPSTGYTDIPLGGEVSVFASIFGVSASHFFTSLFGLLFSPGVGLFIFSPLLLTVFFSFPDFFKKNKSECLLLVSFFAMTLLYHVYTAFWHGLVAWGPRYLLLTIPFLLIPLGASLEQRNKRFMFLIIVILGVLGLFFNMSYVIQDVSWFVWGSPGTDKGLYGLGRINSNLYIHDNVIWTFQYSQLTQSILTMFDVLQHDIYLLHLLDPSLYLIILTSLTLFMFYLLWRIIRYDSLPLKTSKI